jgi:hypothetical protein
MNRKAILVATFWFLLAAVSVSQAPVPPTEARSGDVATGVVEREADGKLYLNTTPCKPPQESEIVVFHQPYKKSSLGEIVCFGHHFDKVSVRQQ